MCLNLIINLSGTFYPTFVTSTGIYSPMEVLSNSNSSSRSNIVLNFSLSRVIVPILELAMVLTMQVAAASDNTIYENGLVELYRVCGSSINIIRGTNSRLHIRLYFILVKLALLNNSIDFSWSLL